METCDVCNELRRGYLWFGGDVRLSDLVGLDYLSGVCGCPEDVEPKLLGIPSLIPPVPSSNPPPETFLACGESFCGSSKLDSGPASPCKCSRLLSPFARVAHAAGRVA